MWPVWKVLSRDGNRYDARPVGIPPRIKQPAVNFNFSIHGVEMSDENLQRLVDEKTLEELMAEIKKDNRQ